MRRHWKRALQMALGLGLALGLLWLFFRRTDWGEAWRAAAGAQVGLLALSMVASLASLGLRALRWQVLLRPLKADVPFARAWRYYIIGFAVSSLLPGRLGELIRPYLLARDQGIGFAPTFATVVTDRVVDLVAVLCVLSLMYLVPSVLGPNASEPEMAAHVALIESVGLVALVVAVATAVVLVLLGARTEGTLAALDRVLRILPKRVAERLARVARSFAEGVSGLGGARQVLAVVGLTVATWGVLAACIWTGLAAFDIRVPYLHSVFLLGVLALGVALPTPGGSGTYHAGVMVVVGQLWGLSRTMESSVAACAIVSHLVAYSPIVLFGVWYLVRDGIRVMRVADEATSSREG